MKEAMNDKPNNLHIGGSEAKEGWRILNIQAGPHVDFVGDIEDLRQFENDCFEQIYCSHVLEHIPHKKVDAALSGIYRTLKPGGKFYVSVPDIDVLCHMMISPRYGLPEKMTILKVMFGGQIDEYDFHKTGFNIHLLTDCLVKAGFKNIKQHKSFEMFSDCSNIWLYGYQISLNVTAEK